MHRYPVGIGGVLRCAGCLRRLRRVAHLDAYSCPSCSQQYRRLDVMLAAR